MESEDPESQNFSSAVWTSKLCLAVFFFVMGKSLAHKFDMKIQCECIQNLLPSELSYMHLW